MRRLLLVAPLALAACTPSRGLSTSDGGVADLATAHDLARPSDLASASDLALGPCDVATDGGTRPRVLACHAACSLPMFASTDLVEEFDDPQGYAQRWTPSYVAPQLAGGNLVFGPHPLTSNWWENYSPVTTNQSFGDALLCVVLKATPSSTGDNSMELSLRGGSEGMVLGLHLKDGQVVLTTKTDPNNNGWTQHDQAPLAFATGPQTIEAILWAHGDRFVAEVHDVDTGAIATLQTTFTLPSTGSAQLLGWDLANALYVDRVVVGTPASDVQSILDDPNH